MLDHYVNVLRDVLRDRDKRIGELELVGGEERRRLEAYSSGAVVEYPKDKTVVELFEEQVLRTPEEVAVVCEGRAVRYRELEERGRRLGERLRRRGVRWSGSWGLWG